ncbi:MAG TPA: hypothetical protein H9740_10625 [Candidatus Hungatella pullicola]|nr:hypothetical protein [Candidatus Hungatella pullicola]
MNRHNSSGMFMMEMIAAVFFFSLCASACILVFARADRLSRGAEDLNQAVLLAQSTAEVWKSQGQKGLAEIFNGEEKENGIQMTFDQEGNPVSDRGKYQVILTEKEEIKAVISVTADDEELYSMEVGRHEQLE